MKKLLLPILFLLFVFPVMSQGLVSINGTITDSATGNPLPNHAVTISNDSTAGWVYYHTTYTYNNGFYVDTVPVPLNSQGILYVRTTDCQNNIHQAVLNYNPSSMIFNVNFQICGTASPGLPILSTGSATGITSTSAILNGYVNPNGSQTSVNFEFGTTASYGFYLSCGQFSGDSIYPVTQELTGLTPGTLYHYRLMGTNSNGTSYGNDNTFTTLGSTGCHADFMVYPDSNAVNSYYFVNQSTGNIAMFTWSFGDGQSQTITFPGNPNVNHTYSSPGTYLVCLSIQGNDSSCYDAQCDTLVVGTPTPCHAAFSAISDSINTYHFTDLSTGSPAIISWNWNFGDPASGANNVSQLQNPIHAFSTPGYYMVCLTIYGSGSCSDVTCDTIVVGTGPGCQANFSYAINPGPGNNIVTFTDLSQGSVLSWLWNFGDPLSGSNNCSTIQNPSHTYTTPGYYNVCLTIAGNNCTSVFCSTVEIQDSVNYHQVYGQVFAGNFPINMGIAMIFSIDTTGSYQPFIDVFPIDSNGVYYFTMVPNGNYYILAIPFDSTAYLPTYYGNKLTWQEATVINLGTANNPYDINLLASGNMTNGPGSATGQINMDQLKSTFMVDKVSMILLNAQGTAIGFTNVSIAGEFNFPTLAFGTYYLHPEMPGITSDNVMIELTPEKPNAEVTMTFVGNSILGVKEEISMVSSWNVYPNPVNDKVSVDLNIKQSSTVQAEIYDLTGHLLVMKQVSLMRGGNHFELAVSSLPTGLYSLRIHSAEGMNLVVKLIKTR